MDFSIETITPSIAERYLGDSAGNRPLKVAKVSSYSRDMAAGNWIANGEPIIFSRSGTLMDGHHRLKACCKSGAEFRSAVIRGAPDEAQKTYDMGASRTIGDALSFHGVKGANHVAAVVLAVASILNGRPRSANLSSSEVFEFIERHPFAKDAGGIAARKSIPRSGTIIGALWMIAAEMGEGQTFDRFIDALESGVPAYEGCPAHAVRERIIRDAAKRSKMSLQDVHRLVVLAWGKFRVGAPAGQFRLTSEYTVEGYKGDRHA